MEPEDFPRTQLQPNEFQQHRYLWWKHCVEEEAELRRVKQKEAWRFGLTVVFPTLTTIAGAFIGLWGWLHGGKP